MTSLDPTLPAGRALWKRLDKAWLATGLILLAVAILRPGDFSGILGTALSALAGTAPFIAFAVFAVAFLKATDAEGLVARAFHGPQVRMIVLAALVGGLAPFCSCEIIPFIAAMLALGAPLSAVMALWLASPLMDPAMFSITAAALGFDFAIAKTIAAVSLGLLGGFGVMALSSTGVFADPLKPRAQPKSCCSSSDPFSRDLVWKFWPHSERRAVFADTALENGLFLLKWLTLAYVLEGLMIAYVPASFVAGFLGGDGIQPVIMGAVIGGPAYLNGFAAVPLVDGLLEQGMSPGAAMSFMLAGGISCIPAAVAVWALVKPRVFVAYIGFGFAGSLVAGLSWAAWVAS